MESAQVHYSLLLTNRLETIEFNSHKSASSAQMPLPF